jgi:glycosyltransferase involved in cell wall biosynthesis
VSQRRLSISDARTAIPHVMQVTYSLAVGGSEQLAAAIAQEGLRRRMRMSICALNHGGGLEAPLRAAGVTTHVIARPPGVHPALIARLAKLFRRGGVSTVITHHLGQLLYSAIGARLSGARLVHVEHDFHSLESDRAKRMLRVAGRLAQTVVGVSEEVVQFLVEEARLPASKVTLIRNGVDTSRYRPPDGRERKKLGVARGPVIGTVGRLDPAKDHLMLLAAFRTIAATVPDAVLVIVGDGPMRPALEAYVKGYGLGEHVRFLGERLDVPALLPGFDVFALSSAHEGLPLALLEALACARPVVATAVGGVKVVVDTCGGGIVVAPGDVDGMTSAMLELLRDPLRAARMGAQGRKVIEERYDVTATLDAYLALCRTPPSAHGAIQCVSGRRVESR